MYSTPISLSSFRSPIGLLWLACSRRGLKALDLRGDRSRILLKFGDPQGTNVVEEETDLHREAFRQLAEYFQGMRRSFQLPLDLDGSPFQLKVWSALLEIPYGETRSYGEVAASVGVPRAARAVGQANGRNPLPIVVPCHRVIAADGSLGGFGSGLDIKRMLLELESGGRPFEG
jgi:methylated-DNA-[protein]-cysteine S-methyltransferase